jgi:PhzF family phenazine biosynthesis protein
MRARPFAQVDVFSDVPLRGNPVAVVFDADGLSTAAMQAFCDWTNLSEATFLLPATDPAADYAVRRFSPGRELPFAGHPTLGTCHAWLEAGGRPHSEGTVIQECGTGLVRIRCDGDALAFAAPQLRRSAPLLPEQLDRVVTALQVAPEDVVDPDQRRLWAWIASARPIPSMSCLSEWCRCTRAVPVRWRRPRRVCSARGARRSVA